MRCADWSAEMSTVSLPAPPSIVMVLKRGSSARSCRSGRHGVVPSPGVDDDLLDIVELGDNRVVVPVRVMTISVADVEIHDSGRERGRTAIDHEGLVLGVAVDDRIGILR